MAVRDWMAIKSSPSHPSPGLQPADATCTNTHCSTLTWCAASRPQTPREANATKTADGRLGVLEVPPWCGAPTLSLPPINLGAAKAHIFISAHIALSLRIKFLRHQNTEKAAAPQFPSMANSSAGWQTGFIEERRKNSAFFLLLLTSTFWSDQNHKRSYIIDCGCYSVGKGKPHGYDTFAYLADKNKTKYSKCQKEKPLPLSK